MESAGASSHSSGDPGRFELIIETIPQLVWVAGTDGAVEYLNRPCREYAGIPLDDLLGWDWGWIVHPVDLPGTLTTWNDALRNGNPLSTEYRLRRHDGQYRWFDVRGTPLRDRDGRILRWYGVCHDINDLKCSNLELRATQRLFRGLVERNPRGCALIGADRTVRYLSPAASRMTGFRPEDVVGHDSWDFAHPDDQVELAQWLAHLLARPGEQIEISYRFLHRDGSYRPLEVYAVNLIPDPDVRAVAVQFWEKARLTRTLPQAQH